MVEQDDTRAEERGRDVLTHVANEMVRAQKQFFGKGPGHARAYILDDLLLIVMRGGLTRAEETMLEFGHQDRSGRSVSSSRTR